MWDFNKTDGVRPMGVNATEAGQYVSTTNVKHHLEVEYSVCQRNDTQHLVAHPQLVVKNKKDLCVGMKRDDVGTGGIFQLENCTTSLTAKHGVGYDIIYGEGLKGRNATLLPRRYNTTASDTLPFVGMMHEEVGKELKNVTVAAAENTYAILQIGDPEVKRNPIY